MRVRKLWFSLGILLIISPLVGACVYSFPERRLSNFNVGLDHPYQGAVIGLGGTYLDASVLHPGREVRRLVFYANGRTIGETASLEADPDFGSSFGTIDWTPPAAGEYLLQVEADALEGPDVISAPVRVCVVDFEFVGGTFAAAFGYQGPCDITVRDESAVPGSITLSAHAAPDSLVYADFLADPPCPEVSETIISFEATVEDPPDEVVFVVVYYSMTFSAGAPTYPGETRTHALVLTHTSTIDPGRQVYTGHTDELSPLLTNYFYREGTGEIRWTARALGRSGEILLEDGPYTIDANSSCGPVTPAIVPPPTATATLEPSEENCPPGTYYAPVTNQCIAIQISSPRPGGGEKCSDHGNSSSCSAAGCTWDGQTQSCK